MGLDPSSKGTPSTPLKFQLELEKSVNGVNVRVITRKHKEMKEDLNEQVEYTKVGRTFFIFLWLFRWKCCIDLLVFLSPVDTKAAQNFLPRNVSRSCLDYERKVEIGGLEREILSCPIFCPVLA